MSRHDACRLAAWAKNNYPSVTRSTEFSCGQAAARGGGELARDGSLGAVRKGIEATVRACVLKVTDVERMWTWETVGGMMSNESFLRLCCACYIPRFRFVSVALWCEADVPFTVPPVV